MSFSHDPASQPQPQAAHRVARFAAQAGQLDLTAAATAAQSPSMHAHAPVDPQLMPPAAAPSGYARYREMTLEELLLENRIVFLVGEINHATATRVIMQMLYLQNNKPGVDINFYINSPGGSVDDTLAMYDTMRFLDCDINTYCIGRAMSGGAVILAAGTKGKRYCLPHAKVMIHQPYGGIYGQTSDVQIQAEEILKTKDLLNKLLAELTGQPVERINDDVERDKYLSATEAKEYGVVDEVIAEQKKKDAS